MTPRLRRLTVAAQRFVLGFIAAVASAGALACETAPLLAPTESAITLTATSAVIPLNGSTEVVARVLDRAGTAVPNGTVVSFSTTLGTMEPQDARTEGGVARARLLATNLSGTATVVAVSGGIASNSVQVLIGSAAAARILLSATPSAVLVTGTTVSITALVLDEAGNRVPGIPVTFSATTGTLSAGLVATDLNGEARVTLVTNRDAVVTATAGAQTAQLTLPINPGPTVTITTPQLPLRAHTTAVFTVAVAPAVGPTGPPVVSVVIDFGDGRVVDLGPVSGNVVVSHVYVERASFLVRVTAVDASGARTVVTTGVTVI